jgi:hypothetical protein
MRKFITVAGIIVIAAIAIAWSQFDRRGTTKVETTGASAPINPNEMMIKHSNVLPFEYWGAF